MVQESPYQRTPRVPSVGFVSNMNASFSVSLQMGASPISQTHSHASPSKNGDKQRVGQARGAQDLSRRFDMVKVGHKSQFIPFTYPHFAGILSFAIYFSLLMFKVDTSPKQVPPLPQRTGCASRRGGCGAGFFERVRG